MGRLHNDLLEQGVQLEMYFYKAKIWVLVTYKKNYLN